MVTEEEKEEIIAAAVEKTLLSIPEVIGNLMANHAALHKINAKFYSDYPEFAGNKDVVQSVIEKLEGKNPLAEYPELLEKAVPEVRKRLEIMKSINTTDAPTEMSRNFSKVDFSQNTNGEV